MSKPYARALSFEERKKIEKLVKCGWSCSQIADAIGRSKNAVVVEIRRGGKEKYTAKAGQHIADENKRKRNEHLSKLNKGKIGNNPVFRFKERIENLEMQIEILHDAIKEVMHAC